MRVAWVVLALLAQGVGQSTVRPGAITGRILAFDGTPAAGVRVGILEPPVQGQPGALRIFTETDSSGRYRLETPPGRYYIGAGPLDAATYFPGIAAIEEAVAVTVASGATQNDRDFKLAIPLLRLSGRVIREGDPSGRQSERKDQVVLSGPGVPQANFGLPVPVVPTGTAAIGADGAFEFRNLPPGQYQLSVVGDALMMPAVQVAVTNDHITGYELRVPRSAVRAAVTVSASVAGRGSLPMFPVQLTQGVPPTGAGAGGARGARGARYSLTVGSQTMPFASENSEVVAGPLTLPAGEYSVATGMGFSRMLPDGFSLESMKAGTVNLLSETLTLAPGDKAKIDIVIKVSSPPPGRKVSGRVKSAMGISAARIGVTGPITFIVPVGPDGAFEFPHVIPGHYLVQIFPDGNTVNGATIVGHLWMKDGELTRLEIPAAFPTFKVSGRGKGLEELRLKGRLSGGPVFARLSEPARPDGAPPGFEPRDLEGHEQALAADGSFQFSGVRPGKYLLTFSSGASMVSDVGPFPKPITLTVVDKDIERLVVDIAPALW